MLVRHLAFPGVFQLDDFAIQKVCYFMGQLTEWSLAIGPKRYRYSIEAAVRAGFGNPKRTATLRAGDALFAIDAALFPRVACYAKTERTDDAKYGYGLQPLDLDSRAQFRSVNHRGLAFPGVLANKTF